MFSDLVAYIRLAPDLPLLVGVTAAVGKVVLLILPRQSEAT